MVSHENRAVLSVRRCSTTPEQQPQIAFDRRLGKPQVIAEVPRHQELAGTCGEQSNS